MLVHCLFTQPPKVLPRPIFLVPGCLGVALAAQPTPNFRGYTLIGFDTESTIAANMKHFKFAMQMPADSTVSSYLCYIQLAFPSSTMFIFETFSAMLEDWTTLFSLAHGEHTIVISFDGADNWVGIYTLISTQFCTDSQKKNKDPVVEAIHFDAYHVIPNISTSPPLYELAQFMGFIPEKQTLKATVSAMWALHVSLLTLKFPAALHFLNNPHASFLQQDVLAYGALDGFYLILLFLAFGRYGFIPEIYNAPSLYLHDSLEATQIDQLAETLIATFHNVS
uniref:Uncharacterized protein n=1 Tax=Romanomermis culicivorax TaxID=13658 RepID=A0A915LAE9_ROMCU